ncbi:MAG: DUF6339 family protein [Clostridium sp.]|nr:DUF6339 family protein [Clostridium sp.]
MKLYFMKKEAMEILKSNLQYTYSKYFTEKTNKWIFDVCEMEPFVEFKEVPYFQLADLNSDLSKGEIDSKNCKIIYENLRFLNESQASDEKLWAGLAHSVFYDYMRRRWSYDKLSPTNAKKYVGEIKTRFFFSGGIRAGFYRNTLAKCWWVGKNTYEDTAINHFEKLDILGTNDISTKITDIFYSNTFSSNPTILNGIIKALKYFKDENINISQMEHIRPTLQFLNAIGGNILLDCLSEEEISEIFIDNIQKILKGDNQAIEFTNTENLEDDDIENDKIKNESNLNTKNKQEVINDEIEKEYVSLGDKVRAREMETGKVRLYKVDYINNVIPKLVEVMLGKTIGDKIEFNGKTYSIITINK